MGVLRAGGIIPEDPADYLIFGTPVLAPCAGQVVLAEGGRPDMAVHQVDEGHPADNHVLLRCGERDILLAHFRQGSLQVAAEDDVARGQEIAEVGNSGESGEPHLHIHAQMPGSPMPCLAACRFRCDLTLGSWCGAISCSRGREACDGARRRKDAGPGTGRGAKTSRGRGVIPAGLRVVGAVLSDRMTVTAAL